MTGYETARRLLARAIGGGVIPAVLFPATESEWIELVEEADYHGVLPTLAPLLHKSEMPQATRRSMGMLELRQRRLATTRENLVDELLRGLGSAGIASVLLKGSALAWLIYPAPEARPMVDIDLLIAPADAREAVRIAERLGFEFETGYRSRFAGVVQHLPQATIVRDGLAISLELHTEALGPDHRFRLNLSQHGEPLQKVARGDRPAGSAFGHGDMLRHLGSHAFEASGRIKLKHLLDITLYRQRFGAEIDWGRLRRLYPDVLVVLDLVEMAFSEEPPARYEGEIGQSMLPLSEIAAAPISFAGKLKAMLAPPGWWLHGHYGVPVDKSLLATRLVRHPLTIASWIVRRYAGAIHTPDQLARARQQN